MRLEEAEDLGREVAGRREPPAKPSPDDAPERRLRGLRRRGLARRRARARLQLRPADRDRDQPRRLDLLQPRGEAVERRVPGEDVRPAPEEHPEHLEEAPERVVERKEAEEDLLLADERERGGPREPLRHQVLHREGDPLLPAGRPRREEDGARLAEGSPRRPRQRGGDGGVGLGGERLAEDDVALSGQLGRLVEEDDPERARHAPGGFPQAPEALLRRDDGQVHAEGVEGGRQLAGSQVRREGRDEEAVQEAGEVDAGGVEAVLRDDRHPGLGLEGRGARRRSRRPAGRRGRSSSAARRRRGRRRRGSCRGAPRPAARASRRGRSGRRRRPRPRRRPTGGAPRGREGRGGGRAGGSCRASGARAPARRPPTARAASAASRSSTARSGRRSRFPAGERFFEARRAAHGSAGRAGSRIARSVAWTPVAPAPTMWERRLAADERRLQAEFPEFLDLLENVASYIGDLDLAKVREVPAETLSDLHEGLLRALDFLDELFALRGEPPPAPEPGIAFGALGPSLKRTLPQRLAAQLADELNALPGRRLEDVSQFAALGLFARVSDLLRFVTFLQEEQAEAIRRAAPPTLLSVRRARRPTEEPAPPPVPAPRSSPHRSRPAPGPAGGCPNGRPRQTAAVPRPAAVALRRRRRQAPDPTSPPTTSGSTKRANGSTPGARPSGSPPTRGLAPLAKASPRRSPWPSRAESRSPWPKESSPPSGRASRPWWPSGPSAARPPRTRRPPKRPSGRRSTTSTCSSPRSSSAGDGTEAFTRVRGSISPANARRILRHTREPEEALRRVTPALATSLVGAVAVTSGSAVKVSVVRLGPGLVETRVSGRVASLLGGPKGRATPLPRPRGARRRGRRPDGLRRAGLSLAGRRTPSRDARAREGRDERLGWSRTLWPPFPGGLSTGGDGARPSPPGGALGRSGAAALRRASRPRPSPRAVAARRTAPCGGFDG